MSTFETFPYIIDVVFNVKQTTIMNQARYKESNEIIDAEDLKIITNPKEIEFICAGNNCGIPVYPCSHLPMNKPRPYFKIGKIDHTSECTYSSFLKLLSLGTSRKLTGEELVKMDFPSKLKLPSKRDQMIDPVRPAIDPDSSTKISTKKIYSDVFNDSKKSSKVVTTINQIVDFYLSCPYNRDVVLDLLGSKKEYYKLFTSVLAAKDVKSQELRVFYGKLNFKRGGTQWVKPQPNIYMIKLFEGFKNDNSPSAEYQPFFISINKDQLSQTRFNRIAYERNQIIEEKVTKFKKGKSTLEEAYIFFVAYPPKIESPGIFEALHGLVVSRFTELSQTILE